ncbi:MAG: hypothetical protein HC837_02495 [Chloroflexaceae bacterium]|nr:hypothetical protein [Chloroflexaceae bacterium]
MAIMEALVAGSVAYAGFRAYRRYCQRRTPVWLIENGEHIKSDAMVVTDPDISQIERRINLNFNLATFSLGLTIVGAVFYEPLILVALPFNLFDAIMMFEDTWTVFIEQSRKWMFVTASSTLVALSLLLHLHLTASVLEWLYFLNQKFSLLVIQTYQQWIHPDDWQPQTVVSL